MSASTSTIEPISFVVSPALILIGFVHISTMMSAPSLELALMPVMNARERGRDGREIFYKVIDPGEPSPPR